MLSLLTLLLAPSPTLLPPDPPALVRGDGQEGRGEHEGRGHQDRGDHEGDRGHEDHGDRREWRGDERRDRREEDDYWKHQRTWQKHDFHEGHEDDRGWDFDHPRHAHPTPPWMNTWWRPREKHHPAGVPGDPSQVYVFVGGRWMLRHVYDPRFRADVSGAFELPEAPPPPVPLPRVGLNLRIVLFN
jgi:hypothetical protein